MKPTPSKEARPTLIAAAALILLSTGVEVARPR